MKKSFLRAGVLLAIIFLPAIICAQQKEVIEVIKHDQPVQEKGVIKDKADLPLYVNDLKYGIPKKRWEAAEVLGDNGDPSVVPALVEALKDEVPKVRENSAEAIGKLKDKSAITPLKLHLKDSHASVRYAVAEALTRLKDINGVPVIVEAIRDTSVPSHRRERIAEAFGILGDKSAVTALIAVINDPTSPKLRENAIYALGAIKDKSAVDPLSLRLPVDESPDCRIAIARSLAMIGDKANSIPPLARALIDKDAGVNKAVSEALKTLVDKDRKVIPILIDLLEPEDTRAYASTALDSFFNEGEDIPLLSKVVGSAGKDKEPARLYAIQRLEKIKDPLGVPPLVEALEDADSIIRARSATALGKLGFPIPVPALIEFVDDSNITVQKCIIIALGNIKDPRADTTLFRIVRDTLKDWNVRVLAAQSAGDLPEEVVLDRLLKGLRDADKDIRYLSAVSFDELKPKSKQALTALDYTAQHDLDERTREASRIALANTEKKAYGREYQ